MIFISKIFCVRVGILAASLIIFDAQVSASGSNHGSRVPPPSNENSHDRSQVPPPPGAIPNQGHSSRHLPRHNSQGHELTYDSSGRIIRQYNPHTGEQITTHYDWNGRNFTHTNLGPLSNPLGSPNPDPTPIYRRENTTARLVPATSNSVLMNERGPLQADPIRDPVPVYPGPPDRAVPPYSAEDGRNGSPPKYSK